MPEIVLERGAFPTAPPGYAETASLSGAPAWAPPPISAVPEAFDPDAVPGGAPPTFAPKPQQAMASAPEPEKSDSIFADAFKQYISAMKPVECIDVLALESGLASWQGYNVQLTTDEQDKVLTIIGSAIERSLEEEKEKVRASLRAKRGKAEVRQDHASGAEVVSTVPDEPAASEPQGAGGSAAEGEVL